jgi:hypothetical protein
MREVVFNIIAYENFAAGKDAKEVAVGLANELKEDREINSALWRFERLCHRQLREPAASEANTGGHDHHVRLCCGGRAVGGRTAQAGRRRRLCGHFDYATQPGQRV